MNKFIISESEKQRILGMHQNATSRQYLSENTTKDVVYTTITLYYDLLPNKVKKRVTYMSFSTNVSTYKTEDIQTIKSFDLGGTVLSPTAQKMSPEKVITGTLPYNKSLESLIGKGASTSTANTLIPTIKTQEGKVTTSMTPLSTIVTVVEQQRQTPIQKESDLTRIVKRVINERQYLMEDDKGHDGQVIDISLPWKKNETGAVIPAREAFIKPEYIAKFIYYPGMKEGAAIKSNGNKPVSQITKIVDNISGTEIPTHGNQTYDSASNSIRGKVVPPRDSKNKYSWDATKTSNYSVYFQDGGVVNPIAVKFKQGTQYTPIQK